MPPRAAPGRGRGRGTRGYGAQRGGGLPRGGAGGRGRGSGPVAIAGGTAGLPSTGVQTVGVRRPGYGRSGRQIALVTNSFVADIPDVVIRHYKVVITPSTLPSKFNMALIERLQNNVAPDIFDPQAVYDGRNNMYASHELLLGLTYSREFDVTMAPSGNGGADIRSPRIYQINVTKVAQINPEALRQFIGGRQSSDNEVLTTLTALNVVIRMDPKKRYPFNSRSFLTSRETRPIGGGIVLWRGYFQSVRPSIGRLLINVDISTGMMYKPGSLIDLCLDFFGRPDLNPNMLAGANIPDRERLRLQKFLLGLRVTLTATNGNRGVPRVVKRLSTHGANQLFFDMVGHGPISIAQYFQQYANRTLRFPQLLCVEIRSGALLPLELCTVPPGQIMRRQIPSNKVDEMVRFSTLRPAERFRCIEAGRDVLAYGQSDYVRSFGLNVKVAEGLLPVNARVLDPPVLKYGAASRQPTVRPRDGAWNMLNKKLFKPMPIETWAFVIYEGQRYFPESAADDLVRDLIAACRVVGIDVREQDPIVRYENGQGRIGEQLRAAGHQCMQKNRTPPKLMVVVLPGDSGNDIYTAVKNFGDTKMGVATQCLKSNKCRNAKPQYWANVCLKINIKLGGINSIPDPSSASLLTDPHHPTIVMGADVQHPAPGYDARPSFPALVGSVDGNCAKYVATTKVQTGRVMLIADLKEMCKHVLNLHIGYRRGVERRGPPTRLIFYRGKFYFLRDLSSVTKVLPIGGVSEGQFQQVLDEELPSIKAACTELGLNLKITLIVVGKRHHVRFKCQDDWDADRSGNCPAGTVVDRDIGHPTEFDFYLQSHGGLIGTSRPSHYSVLFDENEFNADSIQSLSFMLCHVYARATRSVSVPAPLYYADIVSARAKNHYDPEAVLPLSETASQTETSGVLETFVRNFRPLHQNQEKLMYFC